MRGKLFLTRSVFCVVTLLGTVAQAALVYEYNAALDPDGGANTTWEANVSHPTIERDLQLGTAVTRVSASSAYPGITHAYQINGGTNLTTDRIITGTSNTRSYGKTDLPLGGTATDVAGATAAFEMWIKPSALRTAWTDINNEILFETGGSTNGAYVALIDDPNGATLRFRTRRETTLAGQPARNVDVNILLNDNALLGEFMQIVGVISANDEGTQNFGPGNGSMTLYVNGGTLAGGLEATTGGFAAWQDGNSDVGWGSGGGVGLAANQTTIAGGIGGNRTNAQSGSGIDLLFDAFDGQLALLRVYDGPLTAQQVAANFSAVAVPEPTTWGLIATGTLGLLVRSRRGAKPQAANAS